MSLHMLDRVAVVTGCLTRLSVFLEMIEAVAILVGGHKKIIRD